MNSSKELDLNIGKWTNEENLKYAIFMDFHKQKLASRQKKKYKLFNLGISKFLKKCQSSLGQEIQFNAEAIIRN